MRTVFLFLLLCLSQVAFAQPTVFKGGKDAEYIPLTNHLLNEGYRNPDGVRFATTYGDGTKKCFGTVKREGSDIVPITDMITYYASGNVYQKFNLKKNRLQSFSEEGDLVYELVAPVEDSSDYVEKKWYTTGQLRETTLEHHPDGKQRIVFHYEMRYPNKPPEMRQYSHRGALYKAEWHPNGNLLYESTYHGDAESVEDRNIYTYYLPTGEVDTATTYRYHTRSEGHSKTGWIKNGTFLSYWDNGQLKDVERFVGNYKNGPFKRYHRNGNLHMDGTFKNDNLTGRFAKYYTNGRLELLTAYQSNERGPFYGFYTDGTLKRQGLKIHSSFELELQFDSLKGLTYHYVRIGRPMKAIHANYSHDSRFPIEEVENKIYVKGETTNNVLTGTWQGYNSGDTLLWQIDFDEKGVPHGLAYQYHPNGVLGAKVNLEEGILQGPYNTWWSNGNVADAMYFENDRQVGIELNYYENGQLMDSSYRDSIHNWQLAHYTPEGKPSYKSYPYGTEEGLVATHYYHPHGHLMRIIYHNKAHFHSDNDEMWENGNVRTSTRHDNDDPNRILTISYYKDGTMLRRGMRINGYRNGLEETWHSNGRVESVGYYDEKGKLHGEQLWYNEHGIKRPTRYYDHGLEIIQVDPDDIRCSCNFTHEPFPAKSFINLANSFIDFDAIEAEQNEFTFSKGLGTTFFRYNNIGGGAGSGQLINWKELVITTGGLELLINPCRHGANQSELEASFSETEYTDGTKHVLLIATDTIQVRFPIAILQLGDDSRLYYEMLIAGKELFYSTTSGLVYKNNKIVCAPPAQLGETPLYLDQIEGEFRFDSGTSQGVRIITSTFEWKMKNGPVVQGHFNNAYLNGEKVRGALSFATKLSLQEEHEFWLELKNNGIAADRLVKDAKGVYTVHITFEAQNQE